MEINKYIDHTNLKAFATHEDIKKYVKKQKIIILKQYA